MAQEIHLREAFLGGFQKADVLACIENLQNQIHALQAQVEALTAELERARAQTS